MISATLVSLGAQKGGHHSSSQSQGVFAFWAINRRNTGPQDHAIDDTHQDDMVVNQFMMLNLLSNSTVEMPLRMRMRMDVT